MRKTKHPIPNTYATYCDDYSNKFRALNVLRLIHSNVAAAHIYECKLRLLFRYAKPIDPIQAKIKNKKIKQKYL